MADLVNIKNLDGGCLCGAIRYRISGGPFAADHCHCKTCQKSTGAVVASWMDFKTDQIEWSETSPTEFESSEKVRRGFCPTCGTTLSYRNIEHPEFYTLTIASLDLPNLVSPSYHIFTDDQVNWLKIQDDCPRYPLARTS